MRRRRIILRDEDGTSRFRNGFLCSEFVCKVLGRLLDHFQKAAIELWALSGCVFVVSDWWSSKGKSDDANIVKAETRRRMTYVWMCIGIASVRYCNKEYVW